MPMRKALARVSWGRALVLALVLAIHLLVLKLGWHSMVQVPRSQPITQVAGPGRSTTIVFLLEPLVPLAVKSRREDPQIEARPPHQYRVRETTAPAPVYGDEVSNAASKPPVAPTAPSAVAASDEAPKPADPPLNLTLSRESLKAVVPSLSARSPFQGSLPVTAEARIANAAAETGSWTQERIDIDHVRLRRGTTCVVLSRPQIAKIDPFSDSSHRVPWAASQASECK